MRLVEVVKIKWYNHNPNLDRSVSKLNFITFDLSKIQATSMQDCAVEHDTHTQ